MSQDFNLNFDRMLDNDLTEPQAQQDDTQQELYIEAGQYRNLCFVWPDQRKLFLSYSYMASCEHLPEEGAIKIEFTTYSIRLNGLRLEQLFFYLMHQSARIIYCTDKRYNEIKKGEFVVNEIIADKTE